MKKERLISSYDEVNDTFVGKIDGKMGYCADYSISEGIFLSIDKDNLPSSVLVDNASEVLNVSKQILENVRHNVDSFVNGAEQFGGVKTQHRSISPGSCVPAAGILGKGVGGIVNQFQRIAAGQGAQALNIAHITIHMDGQYGRCACSDEGLCRIGVKGAVGGSDVTENRFQAAAHYGMCCRNECKGSGNNFRPGRQPQGAKCSLQRQMAVGKKADLPAAEPLAQSRFKLLMFRPHIGHHATIPQRPYFVAEFLERRERSAGNFQAFIFHRNFF